ncbi:MAG: glycosyltransferase family 39 protein [Actinobacteria bacterium]|nr:glycosyltransferase family 39 protein [Actinomycetota bacterium]
MADGYENSNIKNRNTWFVIYFKNWKNILTFIFLILIAAAGFFLRIRNLGYLSFWGDDGHTVTGTLSILRHGYPLLPSGYVLFHSILDYYFNVIPVLIFGATEFAFRITNVFFGISTIILIYFAGKEFANKFVGFLAAFLLSFSTWYVQFSREARYFAALQFFFLISVYFFYEGFIKDKKPFRVLAAIFFVLTPLVHGIGFTLILSFIPLLFLKGRKFFKKTILVPFAVIVFFNGLQIVNQVFFWKVGRSFYASGSGIRALVKAYFRPPDPYYFKILSIMFPKMFGMFIAGIIIFIAFSAFLSIRKNQGFMNLYLNENTLVAGRLKLPFNLMMIYIIFVLTLTIISFGQMYNQQRYMYFLMPLFVLIFSYIVFMSGFTISKLVKTVFDRFAKGKITTGVFNVILIIVFLLVSFFTLSGINLKEVYAIPFIKHSDNLNTNYSISTTMTYHWDAAATGKYVAEHLGRGDIVITTDIYNSYPYTGKVDYWLWTGNLVSWQPYHTSGSEIRDDTYGVVVIRDIFKFMDVLNSNYDKNIWVICSSSLVHPDHVDPIFRQFFDEKTENLVLTGRDNVSRLYYFSKSANRNRISITDFIPANENNTVKPDDMGGISLDFTNPESGNFLITGWAKVENGLGTWGLDGRSILYVNPGNSSIDVSKSGILEIYAKPLPHPELIQNMEVHVNGNDTGKIQLADKNSFARYFLMMNPGALENGVNVIEFKYDYSFTPLELGLGSDSRDLAVMFKKISIKNLE